MNIREYQKCLSIRPSRIIGAGLGIFANIDIKKDTELGWYRGNIITEKEWKNCKDDSYMWLITDDTEKNYYIDGKYIKNSNKLRYVNGCLTPGQIASVNVEAYQYGLKIWYRTIRKIKNGEELIIDYGKDYWNGVK